MRAIHLQPILMAVGLFAVTGCSIRYTEPPRTADEQFLISYSVMEAIDAITVDRLAGKKVFIDTTYFKAIDQEFIISQIRMKIQMTGATLVGEKEQAEVVAEIRSAGVGVNQSEIFLGIPSLGVPLPTGGALETPELPLIKRVRHVGRSALSMTAYDGASGRAIYAVGPALGRSLKSDWTVVILQFHLVENFPK